MPRKKAVVLDQHAPGAKLDSTKPRPGLVLFGFARALSAISDVGTFGATKYSDNGWMYVADGLRRYGDAHMRHVLAEARGELRDTETGLLHAAHAAWNALARLDLMIRAHETNLPENDDARTDRNQVPDQRRKGIRRPTGSRRPRGRPGRAS